MFVYFWNLRDKEYFVKFDSRQWQISLISTFYPTASGSIQPLHQLPTALNHLEWPSQEFHGITVKAKNIMKLHFALLILSYLNKLGSPSKCLFILKLPKLLNSTLILLQSYGNQGSISSTCLYTAFTWPDHKNEKRHPSCPCLLALLGSARTKALFKALVKLKPEVVFGHSGH